MAARAAFKPHDDGLLDQGDILADVPFVKWSKDGQSIELVPGRGVVTSHGCACEVYQRAVEAGTSSAAARVYVQVAPLRAAKEYRDKVDEIRAGKRLDIFLIEGEGTKLADQVADFTREQPIPAFVLAGCKKVARLADWQWEALLVHVAVARFRVAPERLFRDEILRGGPGGA